MMRENIQLAILLLVTLLLFPSFVLSKRPTTEYEPLLIEKIDRAKKMEKNGDHRSAEEEFLSIYNESKKRFNRKQRSENRWLDYMTSIRAVICYYYRQGNFNEIEWYYREYSDELEGDEGIGAMQLILLEDVKESVSYLIKKGEFINAELSYLDLEHRLGSSLGYQHHLLAELYKYMVALYTEMGKQEEAKKYAEKASKLMKN